MKLFTAAFLALAGTSLTASLPEPDIVFYGKVLHLGGGEPYVMTSGALDWSVTASDREEPFEASTQLAAMKEGEVSYTIRIPQHLVVDGTLEGVLAGLSEGDYRNEAIQLDGEPVRPVDPSDRVLAVSEESRGSYQRLDLVYEGDLEDADGDGLPDWWEDKYGTGTLQASSEADPDNDGANNQAEYLAGTNPSSLETAPRVQGHLLVSLPEGGRAVPVLVVTGTDAEPDDLQYTVESLPDGISLEVLDSDATDVFTQADIASGRVILQHTGTTPAEPVIALTLQDQTSAHTPVEVALTVSVAPAQNLWEGYGLPVAEFPTPFPALQDGSRLTEAANLAAPSGLLELDAMLPGTDYGRLFIGTSQGDHFTGSSEADAFIAGAGDTIVTASGADRIFVPEDITGGFTLAEFSAEEDLIYLADYLTPTDGKLLSDYLKVENGALHINRDGVGTSFNDLVITLPEWEPMPVAADLWDGGALDTGSIKPETTVFLSSTGSLAEEDLQPVTVTIRRRGDASQALSVSLRWSGTAVMGQDYATLPSAAYFPAGEKTITFDVQPLADDQLETEEIVQLEILSAEDYAIADGSRTLVLPLEDLPSYVWIEVAERVAFLQGLSPAEILVRRRGPIGSPLTVRLQVNGDALPGVDYTRLPSSVTFAASQSVVPVQIVPLATANLHLGTETIHVSLQEDSGYRLDEPAQAHLLLTTGPVTMGAWLTEREVDMDPEAFASEDTDRDGYSGLHEFAFGGDPERPDPSSHVRGFCNSESGFCLEYQRRPSSPELTYTVQRSNDMVEWDEVPSEALREISSQIVEGGLERITVSVGEESDGFFYRVHVSKRR